MSEPSSKVKEWEEGCVTVVLPTFNAVAETCDALQSVVAQDYPNWKAVVVDDGSTLGNRDRLRRHVMDLVEPRIILKVLNKNMGVATARNTALQHARGQYIAFLDCDDLWDATKLSRQIAFMKENRAALSFTGYSNFTSSGQTKSVVIPRRKIGYRQLLFGNIIGNSTVMIDRSQVNIPPIPNLRRRQDFALWLLILKDGWTGYGLQKSLTFRRISVGSLSSNKFQATVDTWKMFRHGLNFGPIVAAFLSASHVLLVLIRKYVVKRREANDYDAR